MNKPITLKVDENTYKVLIKQLGGHVFHRELNGEYYIKSATKYGKDVLNGMKMRLWKNKKSIAQM